MRFHYLAGTASVISTLFSLSGALPSVTFPISSQVPPVALVGQQYSFTFERTTFVSSRGAIAYTLRNQPPWLRLNGATRTLFGLVTTKDAGPVTFDLIASDADGATALEVVLFVADEAGPQPGSAILPQLGEAGKTSAPETLLLRPLEPFTISFDRATFSKVSESTTFYATSADNSPLPSWLRFNPSDLILSGRSPPLVSPLAEGQEYALRLIATNVPGFAQATIHFQIVIADHILAFASAFHQIEVSPGQSFQSDALRRTLMLDDRPVDDAQLTSVTSELPRWAELVPHDIQVRGNPPKDAQSQDIFIQATDVFGNVASACIRLQVLDSQSGLFGTIVQAVNATIGRSFSYTITANTADVADVKVTADLSNASAWMTFDAASRTLSGVVPDTAQPGPVYVRLIASLEGVSEEAELLVNLVNPTMSPRSSQMSTEEASPTARATSGPASSAAMSTKEYQRRLAVILGVTVPLAFVLCFGAILSCLWRRKRKRLGKSMQSSRIDPASSAASHRGPSEKENEENPEESASPPGSDRSVDAPRIELEWAPDSLRTSRNRLSKTVTEVQTPASRSDWGNLEIDQSPRRPDNTASPSGRSHDEPDELDELGGSGDWTPFVRSSSAHLNFSRKRTPLRTSQARVQKLSTSSHASKSLRSMSTMSMGLSGRLSGAGHGAGGPGPFEMGQMRYSWRSTAEPASSHDGRSTNLDLSRFPEPPALPQERIDPIDQPGRKPVKSSIRLVTQDADSASSLSEERQKWVRDRARHRNGHGMRLSNSKWSLRYSRRVSAVPAADPLHGFKLSHSQFDDTSPRQIQRRSRLQPLNLTTSDSVRRGSAQKAFDLARRPSSSRAALSRLSSGPLNSAGSRSNSSWVDDLVEEEDAQGQRKWVAVDKTSADSPVFPNPTLAPTRRAERGSWGRPSKIAGLRAFKENMRSDGPGEESGQRRWRLGDDPARRPVSVDEREVPWSAGSHRGNLAFI